MKEQDMSPELLACLEKLVNDIGLDILDVLSAYTKLNPFARFNLSKKDLDQLKITAYSNAIWKLTLCNLKALSLKDVENAQKEISVAIQEVIDEKKLLTEPAL